MCLSNSVFLGNTREVRLLEFSEVCGNVSGCFGKEVGKGEEEECWRKEETGWEGTSAGKNRTAERCNTNIEERGCKWFSWIVEGFYTSFWKTVSDKNS